MQPQSRLEAVVHPVSLLQLGRGARLSLGPAERSTLLCVLSGAARLSPDGDAPVELGCGTVVILPEQTSGTLCCITARSQRGKAGERLSPRGDLPVMGLPDRYGRGFRALAAQLSYNSGSLDLGRGVLAIDLNGIGNLRLAIAAMEGEIVQPRLGLRMLGSALMRTCLVHFHRRHFDQPQHPGQALRTAPALAVVADNPSALHTVDSLARVAGMSRASFARHFQRETGATPMEYLAKVRLEHAMRLLQSTSKPIKVIAAECGFADRSHFSRAFRRFHGKDPSGFRRDCEMDPV